MEDDLLGFISEVGKSIDDIHAQTVEGDCGFSEPPSKHYISCWDIVPQLRSKMNLKRNFAATSLHPRYRPPRDTILRASDVAQTERLDLCFSESFAEILEDLRMPTLLRNKDKEGLIKLPESPLSANELVQPVNLQDSLFMNVQTTSDSIDSTSENGIKLNYGSAEATLHALLKLSSGLHNKWTGMMDGYERVREWQQQMENAAESKPKLVPKSETDYSSLDFNDFLQQLNLERRPSIDAIEMKGINTEVDIVELSLPNYLCPSKSQYIALDAEIESSQELSGIIATEEADDAY